MTRPGEGAILRTSKTRAPADYLARDGDWRAGRQPVTAPERPFEFMMNALRLVEGVEPALYPARTGLDFATLAPRWRTLRDRGLVSDAAERLATTPLGLRHLNSVLATLGD